MISYEQCFIDYTQLSTNQSLQLRFLLQPAADEPGLIMISWDMYKCSHCKLEGLLQFLSDGFDEQFCDQRGPGCQGSQIFICRLSGFLDSRKLKLILTQVPLTLLDSQGWQVNAL